MKRASSQACETTLTERFELGANSKGLCVYCDHTEECHKQVRDETNDSESSVSEDQHPIK